MKTTKTITVAAVLGAVLTALTANAESRIWTDTSGKSIEAERDHGVCHQH